GLGNQLNYVERSVDVVSDLFINCTRNCGSTPWLVFCYRTATSFVASNKPLCIFLGQEKLVALSTMKPEVETFAFSSDQSSYSTPIKPEALRDLRNADHRIFSHRYSQAIIT